MTGAPLCWRPGEPAPPTTLCLQWRLLGDCLRLLPEYINYPTWESTLPFFLLPFLIRRKWKRSKIYCIRSSNPTGIFPVLITTQKRTLPSSQIPSVLSSTRCPCCLLRMMCVCQGKRERKWDSGLSWPTAHIGSVPGSGRRGLEESVPPQNWKSFWEEDLSFFWSKPSSFTLFSFFLSIICYQTCHCPKMNLNVLGKPTTSTCNKSQVDIYEFNFFSPETAQFVDVTYLRVMQCSNLENLFLTIH